jgi:hypothetical protein
MIRLYRMTSASDVRTDHPVLKLCAFPQYLVTWCTDRTTSQGAGTKVNFKFTLKEYISWEVR